MVEWWSGGVVEWWSGGVMEWWCGWDSEAVVDQNPGGLRKRYGALSSARPQEATEAGRDVLSAAAWRAEGLAQSGL